MDELLKALRNKTGFDVVDSNIKAGQLRLLGRVPQLRTGDMLLLIHALKTRATQSPGWDVDISKMYLLRAGKLVFGWRFIFQALTGSIESHMPDVLRTVNRTKPSARREVMEMPLLGASAHRNEQTASGKGAHYSGRARVGPLLRRG